MEFNQRFTTIARERRFMRLRNILLALMLAGALTSVGSVAPASSPSAAPVARAADPGIQPRVTGIAPLSRQVYAYLPYWRLDSGTVDRIDYDTVSTIAFFGLGIKTDGNLDTAWRGYTAYMSDDAVAVTNAAHAKGVRVVPTFQLFDSSSLTKMAAFLSSLTAQKRFIGQALSLMERRSADGASIDFEPLPATISSSFVAFVGRFKTAMKAKFPTAKLVVATSAGAGKDLVVGLGPIVDQMFVMTYNYHWSGSTVAGPIAPLDNDTRTVKIHIARYLTRVAASKIIMGVPWYGYDWPVTSNVPGATVRSDRSAYGGVWSVTYGSAMKWLAGHPSVAREEDVLRGSGFFTYWDAVHNTFRQVYFEDELSAAAKYDYAIAQNLAGVGLWTLDGDRGFSQMKDVLRAKFYAPVHKEQVTAKTGSLSLRSGYVRVYRSVTAKNVGNVPEIGTLSWRIWSPSGKAIKSGSQKMTLYPGAVGKIIGTIVLGRASDLRSGTYKLTAKFVSAYGTWRAPAWYFRQPY